MKNKTIKLILGLYTAGVILTSPILPYKEEGIVTHHYSIADSVYMDIVEDTSFTLNNITSAIQGK